jgi:predicted transcriptional regulator
VKRTVSERQKEILIGAVDSGESIKTAQVMEMLGIGASRARKILAELVNEETFEASGAKKDRVYRLKSKG